MQRLGRARQRFAGAAQHCATSVATEPAGKLMTVST
jgi:hypothetical protein